MEAVWLIVVLCIVATLVVVIMEISGWQAERAIEKMRLADERKATEEAQLVEKIRSIAKAVCVEDSMAVHGMKGNVYTSEDGKTAISKFPATMKVLEK